jgi:HD-like signal output (HDOD) protein
MIDDIKNLPPLPASIRKIQELCMEDEINLSLLIKTIETDPMLCANILKASNSPLYGMSREIHSVNQAVMLFGVTMIRGFAAANAIKKIFPLDISPYGITVECLSEISTLQQALVRGWYSGVDKTKLPLLLSASFLMELGKLAAAFRILKLGHKEEFVQALEQFGEISVVETQFLGMDSYSIGSAMFQHWHFESELIDVLKQIHAPKPGSLASILNVVGTAINVNESLSEGSIKRAIVAIEQFGLDRVSFEKAVNELKDINANRANTSCR